MSHTKIAPKYKRPRQQEFRVSDYLIGDERARFDFHDPVKLRKDSKGRRVAVTKIEVTMEGWWKVTESFSVRKSEEVRLVDGRSLDSRRSEIEERTRDVFDPDEIEYLQRCMESGRRPDI